MVRKIAVILEFKYTECLQSYLLFIALYLLFGTECWNYKLADKNIDLRWMSGGCGNTFGIHRNKDCRAI